jgi:hypothetical protein
MRVCKRYSLGCLGYGEKGLEGEEMGAWNWWEYVSCTLPTIFLLLARPAPGAYVVVTSSCAESGIIDKCAVYIRAIAESVVDVL